MFPLDLSTLKMFSHFPTSVEGLKLHTISELVWNYKAKIYKENTMLTKNTNILILSLENGREIADMNTTCNVFPQIRVMKS